MAQNIFKTKIALLYKSYAEWDAIKDSYIPLKGEVCFCEVPTATNVAKNEPCILFKVGDGVKAFADLPWVSGLAADVYSWAKKENLDFGDLSEDFLATLDARTDEAIKEAVKDITGAMHFIGAASKQDGETDLDAINRLLTEKAHTAKSGDLVIIDAKEYVFDGDAWVELGDEKIYATKEEVEAVKEDLADSKKEISGLSSLAKSGDAKDLKQSAGDILILNCNDETYKVEANGKYYASLQEVIDSENNIKLELVDDVDLQEKPLTIEKGKTVELALSNHQIKNVDKENTIINKGTLVIKGAGVVDNVSNKKASIFNDVGATLTLDDGIFTRSKESSIDAGNSGENSYYTIKNYGDLTINEGVEVNQGPNHAGKYSSLITNGWYSYANYSKKDEPVPVEGIKAKLTINGGKFSGGLNTIKNDDNSELIINGGEFDNYAQCVLLNVNEATINGGTFRAHDTSDVTIVTRAENGTIDKGITKITGGVFEGNLGNIKAVSNGATPVVEITGGTFTEDVSAYVKKPHKVTKKNNLYIVE